MSIATTTAATGATIRPEEAAHFGKLAAEWWDPKGSSAMLHKLNPVRLAFLREAIDSHFGANPRTLRPLAGRSALDVGCGAGLLAEPLARMGAAVTAVDAAEENIAAAKAHAQGGGLAIDYRHGELSALGLGQFDLVTSMEVIEHVADKAAFVAGLTERVAEGTHHWEDFITPLELSDLLADAGFAMGNPKGIAWSPLKGLHLSDDLALNYIVTAKKSDGRDA